MLELIGLNINKLFKFYETNSYPKFWFAPCDLKPQTFKNPTAKRLSKKVIKLTLNFTKINKHSLFINLTTSIF